MVDDLFRKGPRGFGRGRAKAAEADALASANLE